MEVIFNKIYILNNKPTFYSVILVLFLIILFSVIMAYKEIKNDNK